MASSLRSRFLPRSLPREPKDKKPSSEPTVQAATNGLHIGASPATTNGSDNHNHGVSIESRISDLFKVFSFKNLRTLKDVALEGISGEDVDDKTYLMERIVQLAAELPVNSPNSQTLTKAFLSQLWHDLQHPPLSYLGDEYIYRKADGSYNNVLYPHIGAAGQPYARSVQPKQKQPVARPDPGLLFDSLLARKTFIPHPNKISSNLFYFASIIIHDIFHTSHTNFGTSETSSYLDLAPLYGSSEKQQKRVRTMKDGKLKPDCFADERILGFPPGVGLLLIMFNRFHNHVVENLARIDENGRFSSILRPIGRPLPGNALELYDEALFQTGRLITTGLYINVVLKDYVRTILNLNRVDSLWNLDPRSEEGKSMFVEKIPEATGNQVSAEFNLVYRWHSCVSERDDKWTQEAFKKIFGSTSQSSLGEMMKALQKWSADMIELDPQDRPFEDLKRNSEGRFDDDVLAAMWTANVDDVAGSFGARHVPAILKDVEILGIIQARAWNLASLNEFRQFFKLQPHQRFEDINPDPEVAEALRRLYGHPDHVELYPGIVVESAKEPMEPGSGLCTNFTTSRAILSDATALVRGDRFYTVDYTPKNLTNWGYEAANYDTTINYGCVLYKLVLTAFPNNFSQDSIYAHYPFVISRENRSILKGLKLNGPYNFEKPTRSSPTLTLTSFTACLDILGNPSDFSSAWRPENWLPTQNFIEPKNQASLLSQLLLDNSSMPQIVKDFYQSTTTNLLEQSSYSLAGVNHVDIIEDVMNMAHLKLVASLLCLPIKDDSNLNGYSEKDLIELMSSTAAHVFSHLETGNRTTVSRRAHNRIDALGNDVEEVVDSLVSHWDNPFSQESEAETHKLRTYMIEEMTKRKIPARQIVWSYLLPTAGVMLTTLARLSAQSINYILEHKDALSQLQTSTKSNDDLEKFVLEVQRLSGSTSFSRRANVASTINDSDQSVQVKAGQMIICNLSTACYNPTSIREPSKLTFDRDPSMYSLSAFGPEVGLIYEIHKLSMMVTLKMLGSLPNLDRAVGPEGQLKKVLNAEGLEVYMNAEESEYQSCPGPMKITWT